MCARFSGLVVLGIVLLSPSVQTANAQQDLSGPKSPPNFVAAMIVEEDGITQIMISSGNAVRMAAQTYKVDVPVTQNGVTKIIEVQRVRTVPVAENTPPIVKLLKDVKFRMVNGKEVDANAAKSRMKNAIPAIMLTDADSLDPFFAEIVKPETIIILLPKN